MPQFGNNHHDHYITIVTTLEPYLYFTNQKETVARFHIEFSFCTKLVEMIITSKDDYLVVQIFENADESYKFCG